MGYNNDYSFIGCLLLDSKDSVAFYCRRHRIHVKSYTRSQAYLDKIYMWGRVPLKKIHLSWPITKPRQGGREWVSRCIITNDHCISAFFLTLVKIILSGTKLGEKVGTSVQFRTYFLVADRQLCDSTFCQQFYECFKQIGLSTWEFEENKSMTTYSNGFIRSNISIL